MTGHKSARVTAVAGLNAQVLVAVPCRLTGLYLTGGNATVRYLKVYDKATTPRPGSDIPIAIFGVNNNAAYCGRVPIPDPGVAMQNGIAISMSTSASDGDSAGSVAASDIDATILYIQD